MLFYLTACFYVFAALALVFIRYVADNDSNSGRYFLTAIVFFGAVWAAVYSDEQKLPELLSERISKLNVFSRIIVPPALSAIWLLIGIIVTYIAATFVEIFRRIFISEVHMHNAWLFILTVVISAFMMVVVVDITKKLLR